MRKLGRRQTAKWVSRLREFLPELAVQYPAIRPVWRRATIILHGSASTGVHDRWSDLDAWFWVPRRDLRRIDAASPTRFFEFTIDGRPGHANADAREDILASVRACHLELIHELRHAVVVQDPGGFGRRMIALARRRMRPTVRRRLFFHEYVEMRGEHRSLDNPLNRRDHAAVLFALGKTLSHALRAAMVLDGEPTPYDKWLVQAASKTPTGRLVARRVRHIVRFVGKGALNLREGDARHPLNLEIRKIRADLVAAAHRRGIKDGWLQKWWLWIDEARGAREGVRW